MQKIAAIYARVSGDKQKIEVTIASQVEACQNYAQEHRFLIPEGCIITDDGFKGASYRRPGLERLRDLVQKDIIDTVIILCPDRLSRKMSSQFVLEEEFRMIGVSIEYVEVPPAKNPEEQVNIHIRAVFAEYEREKIVERCRRGRNYKARQGNLSVIPSAPFGYNYIPKNKSAKGYYEINLNNSKIVQEIYHMYTVECFPILKICQELHLKGVLAPKGGRVWDPATIRDILSNTKYIGIAYFGKTENCEVPAEKIRRSKNGKVFKNIISRRKKRDKEDWIELSVPAFITEAQFCRAQELLESNKAQAARNTKRPSILQGLLVCKNCGLPLYKKVRRKKSVYSCRSKLERKLQSCGSSDIDQEAVDGLIWNEVIELLKNPQLITFELNKRSQESTEDPNNKKIDELHRELKKISNQRDKLLDIYQTGDCVTIDEFRKRMENLNKEKRNLESALERLKASKILQQSHSEIMITLEQCLEKIDRSSESLDVMQKQKILRLLIDEIIVSKDEVLIKHSIPLNKRATKEEACCPLLGDRYNSLPGCSSSGANPGNDFDQLIFKLNILKNS